MKKTNIPLSKKILQALWILYVLVSTFLLLPQIDRLLIKDYVSMSEYISLDDSWEISIDDDIFQDVSLDVFRFDAVKKGDVKRLKQRFLRNCYRTLFIVQASATASMIVLHGLDAAHLAATLQYMQALIVCDLVYFLLIEILNLKCSQPIDRLFLVGMLMIGGCVTCELAGYCLHRYFGASSPAFCGAAPVGVVIFIVILICSFYFNLTRKLMQETERNFLLKSAYTDELTQIHNRRYCMEYMNKIKESGNSDYTIICFDLNDLKITNDTYGHARGDILIKSAAEVIKDTFEPHGVVARIGCDEFISILNTTLPEEISGLLEKFHADIRQKNREISNLNMSIAYGCASCSPQEHNIDIIYQTADNRMYEKKRQMKQQDCKS